MQDRALLTLTQVPKLGTVQRWVRLADLSGREELSAQLLDAIMRCAAATARGPKLASPGRNQVGDTRADVVRQTTEGGEGEVEGAGTKLPLGGGSSPPLWSGSVRRHPAWVPNATDGRDLEAAADDDADRASGKDASDPAEAAEAAAARAALARCEGRVRVVGTDEAPMMNSTNPIYMTEPGVIAFQAATERAPVARVDVPFVPGAFALIGVLSRAEAAQVVYASRSLFSLSSSSYSLTLPSLPSCNQSFFRSWLFRSVWAMPLTQITRSAQPQQQQTTELPTPPRCPSSSSRLTTRGDRRRQWRELLDLWSPRQSAEQVAEVSVLLGPLLAASELPGACGSQTIPSFRRCWRESRGCCPRGSAAEICWGSMPGGGFTDTTRDPVRREGQLPIYFFSDDLMSRGRCCI